MNKPTPQHVDLVPPLLGELAKTFPLMARWIQHPGTVPISATLGGRTLLLILNPRQPCARAMLLDGNRAALTRALDRIRPGAVLILHPLEK